MNIHVFLFAYRYTEGAASVLYAMFLRWPHDGKIIIECVKHLNESADIEFLGLDKKLMVMLKYIQFDFKKLKC